MLLTRKNLKEYQEDMRIYIPEELQKKILDIYGTLEPDENGHLCEFTEQDIYEQLRKIIIDKKPSTIDFDNEGRPNLS